MRKFNYRTTVHIENTTLKLGLRAKLPTDAGESKIRVQAIFTQEGEDRRYPMAVRIINEDLGPQIYADAVVELPYVFVNSPREKVNVTFSVWIGMEETILRDQPFPIQEDYFKRNDRKTNKKPGKFILSCFALPVWAGKSYLSSKDKKAALKEANAKIYQFSGYSFSPRQRNTDYFVAKYKQFVNKIAIKQNNVLFLSERLPEEGGNLQLVMEECRKDRDISVSKFIVPKTVDSLSKRELRNCARLCARAHVIVLEDFYPQLHSLEIRPQTKIVQLWHACGAFKTFGFTRMGKSGGVDQDSMNHRNYDLVSVSSDTVRDIYAEAFAITSDRVKALGIPRTDPLFDPASRKRKREAIFEKYPRLDGKKIVLFAPTFRGDGNKDAYYPDDAFDVNRFMEDTPEDMVCIVKHHPFVHKTYEVDVKYKDRVLDLTGQDHINDLMLVSDLLITDYSSSVFEAVLIGIPILFYAFDKKEYIRSRDFYCDFDHFAPGFVETDFEKMKERTQNILYGQPDARTMKEILDKKTHFTKDFLSALDGHSTRRISSYIKDKMLSELVKKR